MERPGDIIGPGYRLLRRLSGGDLGETWLALGAAPVGAAASAAEIVVKIASGAASSWGVPREIAAAARRPRHAALVAALDHGALPDGRAWLALERVAGPPLAALLHRGGALAPADAVAVGRRLAAALAALHRVGILHRDLKPTNVLIPGGPAAPRWAEARLIDLGVAALVDPAGPRTTRPGQTSGTPRWAAPEQRAARAQGPATDVWGLGALLYAMLTVRVPYDATAEGTPTARRLRWPHPAPRSLKRLVRGCLAAAPGDRPDLAEAAAALSAS